MLMREIMTKNYQEFLKDKIAIPELSDIETIRLSELETVVERGLQTFYAVGIALAEIRDGRLYRQQYKTWEEYCSVRWALSETRSRQLINAATGDGS